MREILGVFIAVLFAAWSSAALAAPITYYVYDANWTDGGTLTGQFTFDADTNTYSDISLVTTMGSAYPGATYVAVNPSTGATADFLIAVTAAGTGAGQPVLALGFDLSLTNAGGSIPLASSTGEGVCRAGGCTSFDGGPRFMFPGATVSDEPPPPIPTMSEWAMILMGLTLAAGALLAIRRQTAALRV